jgi:hypothetical protein
MREIYRARPMPSKVFALVALCRKIRSASDDELRSLDRSSLVVAKEALKGLRDEIDIVLARLALIDDQSLH